MNVRALVIGIVVLSLTIPLVTSADDGFDASFSPKAGNEWWVEVFIDANEPLAGVEARADGGAWHRLTLRSWGAWAGSFHVPDGSIVTFRATSSDGDTDLSQGYVWPSATPASSGETGSFDATFRPKAGNEWWVEVFVDANEPISAVAAQADGGTWHGLTLRSWGAWAGSFHVPDGSIVTFRATSTDGDIDVSAGYVWPGATPAGPSDGGDGGGSDRGGDFDATFDPKAGNEWWVEVFIDANQKVTSVAAQADGGTWHTLTLRSWGAWAGSFHVPDGSIVTFRATSSSGETDTSGGYLWPSATPSEGDSTPPPSTPTTDLAFGPKKGNEWWIETYVIGDHENIASVDARIVGGTWHTLTLRDWDTWAGSFHVPSGSTVEFRATTDEGTTDTSDTFHWPSALPTEGSTSWPHEGSYVRYGHSWSNPAPATADGTCTAVFHDARWVAFCETHEEWPEGPKTDLWWGEGRAPHGPTGVAIGDEVTVETSVYNPTTYTVIVEGHDTDQVRKDGKTVTVDTYRGYREDDCRCLSWSAEWETSTGLVTHAARAGLHGGIQNGLLDTDAPIA